VDEDGPSISPPDLYARLGADAAPITPGVRRSADPDDKLVIPTHDQAKRSPLNSLRESSVVVYCGDVQQVSEGFAIALRAMGVVASIQNREGN
jgi:hypothetical protein